MSDVQPRPVFPLAESIEEKGTEIHDLAVVIREVLFILGPHSTERQLVRYLRHLRMNLAPSTQYSDLVYRPSKAKQGIIIAQADLVIRGIHGLMNPATRSIPRNPAINHD